MKNIKLFFLMIFFIFLFFINPVLATEPSAAPPAGNNCLDQKSWLSSLPTIMTELIPPGCRCGQQPRPLVSTGIMATAQGTCGFNEVMQLFVNITKIFFGIIGSVLLLMFVYGGLIFVISQGNKEKIDQAKGIVTSAVIGLVIIMTAWVIVNLIVSALSLGKVGGLGQIFGQDWVKAIKWQ